MAAPHLDPLLLMAPFIRRGGAAAPAPVLAMPDPKVAPHRPPSRRLAARRCGNGLARSARPIRGGRAFAAFSAAGFFLVAACVVFGVARIFT